MGLREDPRGGSADCALAVIGVIPRARLRPTRTEMDVNVMPTITGQHPEPIPSSGEPVKYQKR